MGKILNNIGCALYETMDKLREAMLTFEEALEIHCETLQDVASYLSLLVRAQPASHPPDTWLQPLSTCMIPMLQMRSSKASSVPLCGRLMTISQKLAHGRIQVLSPTLLHRLRHTSLVRCATLYLKETKAGMKTRKLLSATAKEER